MVMSNHLSSTAGVLVEDSLYRQFLTVASHRLSEHDSIVYHPNIRDDLAVCEGFHRTGATDLALVALNRNICFKNVTFQLDSQPDPVTLRQIKDALDLKGFSALSMDNSFTGCIDCQLPPVGLHRVSSDAGFEYVWLQQQDL